MGQSGRRHICYCDNVQRLNEMNSKKNGRENYFSSS